MQSTYSTLPVQHRPALMSGSTSIRLFGLLFLVLGFAGWWYNWHLAATRHEFYIKLCIFGPFAIFGGLLMILRPDWAGPVQAGSSKAQKTALIALIAGVFIMSGVDFYRLKNYQQPARRPLAKVPVAAGRPTLPNTPQITFLGRTYHLGSFNQKHNPTWEFVTPQDTVNNWKTLVTIVERPDARTKQDLDRLAEGLMSTYKSHKAQILSAKTMRDDSGAPYNYMVAAFEEPGQKRFELNFVKMSMGVNSAVVVIYGVRITDPQNYLAKAKDFLNQSSSEVGQALNSAALPDLAKLPRRTF